VTVGVGARRSSGGTDAVLGSANRPNEGTERDLGALSGGGGERPQAGGMQRRINSKKRLFHWVLIVHLFFGRGSV